MKKICEKCGGSGSENLLIYCNNCKRATLHQYCLDTIVFDRALVEWLCCECQSNHSDFTYQKSPEENMTHQRRQSPLYFDTPKMDMLGTKGMEAANESRSWKNYRTRSPHPAHKERFRPVKTNYLREDVTRTYSNMRSIPRGYDKTKNDITVKIACAPREDDGLPSSSNTVKQSIPSRMDGLFSSSRNVNQSNPLRMEDGSNVALRSLQQSPPLKAMERLVRKSKNVSKSSSSKAMKGLVLKTKNVGIANSCNDYLSSRPKNMEQLGPSNGREDLGVVMEKNVERSKCLNDNKVFTPKLKKPMRSPLSDAKECLVPCEYNSKEDEVLVGIKNKEMLSQKGGVSSRDTMCGDVHVNPNNSKGNTSKPKGGPNLKSSLKDNHAVQTELLDAHQAFGNSKPSNNHDKRGNPSKDKGGPNLKSSLKGSHAVQSEPFEAIQAFQNDKPPNNRNKQVYTLKAKERHSRKSSLKGNHAVQTELADASKAFGNDRPKKRRRATQTCLVSSKDNSKKDKISAGIRNKEIQNQKRVVSSRDTLCGDVHCSPSNGNKQGNTFKAKGGPNAKSSLKGNHAGQTELPDASQAFGNDNPKKRRQLILPYDDDHENVQLEDLNTPSFDNAREVKKQRRFIKENDEEAVLHRNLSPKFFKGRSEDDGKEAAPLENANTQPCKNERQVKKRRRYIETSEDEELAVTGAHNAGSAQNDHCGEASRAFNSESVSHQNCEFSQAIDEPIWSGIFEIGSNGFVSLAAHLSNKACERVWELSRSLLPVVEVMKLSRSEAWPKSWEALRPTDDCIGLYFFPHNMRPNEELDQLVKEVMESDMVLRAVVGTAELLIFPSIVLPEQYHTFQRKHYLWGVFKRREASFHKCVLAEEQGGIAAFVEEDVQEQHVPDQQDEAHCEASNQEISAMKHSVRLENQLLEHFNHPSENKAFKTSAGGREAVVSSNGTSASAMETNSLEVESNCSLQPGVEVELQATEEADHQLLQEFTSKSESGALPLPKPSSNSGPSAAFTKVTTSADCGHPQVGTVAPMVKMFGFVVAHTPRTEQLLQEMESEGALLFAGQQEMMSPRSRIGHSNRVALGVELTPDNAQVTEFSHPQEHRFVLMDHDEGASKTCLELFPVKQEQIGWTPKLGVSKGVDLDLSLGGTSRGPSTRV